MNSTELLIIGSGPGGVSAAESYRDNGGSGRVLIVTSDPDLPYFRPPLSKDYLQGDSGPDDVALHPREWYSERNIEVRTDTSVLELDTTAKNARLSTSETIDFGTAIIATGARPVPIPVPGGEHALLLRSFSEASSLREGAEKAASAVVIGAGFIGCEAAASLASRGVTTTLVAPNDVPQESRLGPDAGARIRAMLDDSGVRYVGGPNVVKIEPGAVTLDDGVRIDADLILAATGITPCADIAESAGLKVDDGRIVVDEHMRTSAASVLAVGDVATAHNTAAGRQVATEHWQDAVDQGEVAGATAAGVDTSWDSVPGFWTTIGNHTLKYAAWGDGYDSAHLVERNGGFPEGGFTVWYQRGGVTVGGLTFNSNDDYDLAEKLVADHKPPPG
ncbi:NAD(P)/FAD-dependent oxidoreductase [Williamsia soli]|uniref:NAD(P)/FAD-dependent oxidoreductase n=1 Tax=Williamsia soli TaxID=364929 RepID=UPI001A9F5DC5|nr:FAD-dependent oxidoreductase [Williamsia soli]